MFGAFVFNWRTTRKRTHAHLTNGCMIDQRFLSLSIHQYHLAVWLTRLGIITEIMNSVFNVIHRVSSLGFLPIANTFGHCPLKRIESAVCACVSRCHVGVCLTCIKTDHRIKSASLAIDLNHYGMVLGVCVCACVCFAWVCLAWWCLLLCTGRNYRSFVSLVATKFCLIKFTLLWWTHLVAFNFVFSVCVCVRLDQTYWASAEWTDYWRHFFTQLHRSYLSSPLFALLLVCFFLLLPIPPFASIYLWSSASFSPFSTLSILDLIRICPNDHVLLGSVWYQTLALFGIYFS